MQKVIVCVCECVCECVCVSECVCECVCVSEYVCEFVWVCVSVCEWVWVCVSVCAYVWCVCMCVWCVYVCVHVYNYTFGLLNQSIFVVHSFTPYNILCALFICSCFVVNHFHIFTMFLVFLWFLLTIMPRMLAPIPKPHIVVPTSKSGYVVDMAISKRPIQTEETAIWTASRLPRNSIMMPLSREPTELAPM